MVNAGHLADGDVIRQRLHQRHRLPDPRYEKAARYRAGQAALLASMPNFGMVVTLIVWGYLLDRIGERIVLTAGLALTAIASGRGVGEFDAGDGGVSVPRRHGRRQHHHGQRPLGHRLVPARKASPGNGHPADRAAAGNRGGRRGDAGARQTRLLASSAVSRGVVRGGWRWPACWRTRPAASDARGGRRGRVGQPVYGDRSVVADSPGVGIADGAAAGGVDVHVGLVDGRATACRSRKPVR